MPGCGGCEPGQCNGPCSTRERQQVRTPTQLTEALAKVIVDNRIVRFTLGYYKEHPNASVDEIIAAANIAKERGELV